MVDGISRDVSTRRAIRAHLRRGNDQDQHPSDCSVAHCEDCLKKDRQITQRHTFTFVDGYSSNARTRKAVRVHLARQRRPALRKDLGGGNSDPFSAAAVNITPSMHLYLLHYRNAFAIFTSPLTGSQHADHVPIMLSDALWLHSAAAACAADLSEIVRKRQTSSGIATQHSRDYSLQKSKMISLLNTKITTQDHGTSDATVAAVANLATAEATVGNFVEWKIHMTGLRWMVHVRGGLTRLDPYLSWYLSMIDVKISMATLSGTRFAGSIFAAGNSTQPSREPSVNISDHLTADADLQCFGTLFSQKREELSAVMHCQLLDILADLSQVAIDWEMHRRHSVSLDRIQGQALSTQELTVEYQLLNFPQQKHRTYLNRHQEDFITCERLAAVAFVNTGVLSNDPIVASNFEGLRTGLREAIGKVEHVLHTSDTSSRSTGMHCSSDGVSPAEHQVLLWCCFVGAYLSHAHARQARGWILNKILGCAAMLSLGSWAGVRNVLQTCFYTPRFYDEPFRQIWEESHRMSP